MNSGGGGGAPLAFPGFGYHRPSVSLSVAQGFSNFFDSENNLLIHGTPELHSEFVESDMRTIRKYVHHSTRDMVCHRNISISLHSV